jgi:subtilase family serine protease
LHEVFLQAALQGESLFAAAGDAGAYDANNNGMFPPYFTLALSVDSPASDPYITAAGGTTLAGEQTYDTFEGEFVAIIPHESVWSWDYLEEVCYDLEFNDYFECGIFPVGSGGGVSFEFALPFYQAGLRGIQRTQPDQSLVEETIPPQTIFDIPADFAGRNVPDISFNADPGTGYVVYYTSDEFGFGESTFYGGTSFVAPQLSGVLGLIGQYVDGRIGLLNVPMYKLARSAGAYTRGGGPFNYIFEGNNDFYLGRYGYSPAAGLGTLDVVNFADALKSIY